jgi:arylsulfatase A-like enzyme
MDEEVDEKVPYIKAGALNKRVDHWLDSRGLQGRKDPFFLWLHYMDVHEPYVPDGRFVAQVDPTLNLNAEQMFSLFTETLLKRDVSDPQKVELLKSLYLAHVREVDDAVEELFGILDKHEIHSETTVIITSDHGDEFGEHGGLSHDGKMYRELVDVPLLIYQPNRIEGMVCQQLVSTLDISPTIVELFDQQPVPQFQGASLVPTDSLESRTVFGEAYHKVGRHEPKENLKEIHYCREQDVKIIYSEHEDDWQLFDLATDPGEKDNVIDSHPTAMELKLKLQRRVRRREAK